VGEGRAEKWLKKLERGSALKKGWPKHLVRVMHNFQFSIWRCTRHIDAVFLLYEAPFNSLLEMPYEKGVGGEGGNFSHFQFSIGDAPNGL